MSTNTQKASAKPASRKFAKSVIEIWLWGGPSQLETFDPKPDAPHDYNNGLKSIKSANGYELHEWLPELAKCSNLYSIIRSMTHPFPGHETATYLMQTGRNPGGGVTFPALGALISSSRVKGAGKKNSVQSDMLYEGDLPPFVILTHAKGRFSEVGFLGEEYAPLVTGGSAAAKRFEVDGIVPPGGLTREQIVDRFGRASRIDRLPPDAEFEAAGAAAREIILGKAAETFDLTREKEQTRKRYGVKANGTTYTEIGQQLLAARRLVEYGVPYISINYSGWDSHKRHFETMKQPTFERTSTSAVSSTLRSSGSAASSAACRRWTASRRGTVGATTSRAASPPSSRAADSRAAAWSARATRRPTTGRSAPSRRRTSSARSWSLRASIPTTVCPIPSG